MNQIPTRQNENTQLERLGAQRELYSRAKIWYGWQTLVNVGVPTLFSLLAIQYPLFGNVGAVYGLLVSLGDIFGLEPNVKLLREKAAKVQEQFDCDQLELGCSPLKAVNDVTVEEVIEVNTAHCRNPSNRPSLRNWHSQAISLLPLPVARLIYQRNNCWWDKRLRERYRRTVFLFMLIVGGGVLFFNRPATTSDKEIVGFILVVAAMTPFFSFCAKQISEQSEAINRLKQIVLFVDSITTDQQQLQNGRVLAERARQIQDEIYDNRSKSPLVPDFFYHMYRNTDEDLMNRSTNRLVSDIHRTLTTP